MLHVCRINNYNYWQVIPPGMEFNHIIPHDGDMDGEADGTEDRQASPDPPIWAEVNAIMFFFLSSPCRLVEPINK